MARQWATAQLSAITFALFSIGATASWDLTDEARSRTKFDSRDDARSAFSSTCSKTATEQQEQHELTAMKIELAQIKMSKKIKMLASPNKHIDETDEDTTGVVSEAPPDGPKAVGPKCVVWHAQHKSAGRTISTTLELDKKIEKGCKYSCDAETWDCERQTCTEEKSGFDCEPGHQRIARKGYTPVLAGSRAWGSPGDGKCVWATMSREPVSRLISALFYCRNGDPFDPLCGKFRLPAKDASIQDWAKHWGNYLFREMLLHPELREAARSRKSFNASAKCDTSYTHPYLWAPWVQFKDQLNGGDDPHTNDGALNFKAVKQALRGEGNWKLLYDVFGVVEMWNESMALFDESMPLDGESWITASEKSRNDHGSGSWKHDELNALAEARKDPVVLEAISADIELYNSVIVPMFQRKVREAKLAGRQ